MQIQDFLARVLPTTGERFWSATVDANNKNFQQTEADDYLTFCTNINKLKKANKNTFFAPSSFVAGGDRSTASVAAKRCYYADIDSDPIDPKKHYKTYEEALEAVKTLLRSKVLPLPSYLVKSGNGIHIYWTLDVAVTVAEWLPVATALKDILEANIYPDETVTADVARVLRVPNTLNTKPGKPPVECKILKDFGCVYTQEQMRQALHVELGEELEGGYLGVSSALSVNDDLSGGLSTLNKKWYAGPIFDKCNVLAYQLETRGKDAPGTLWHRALHLLAFTEDGEKYIHEISKGHDEYTEASTNKRYYISRNQKPDDSRPGPTTCAAFEEVDSLHCAGCKYRGHIKTPIVLGDADKLQLPTDYYQTQKGVFKHVRDKEGAVQASAFIMPYNFVDFKVARDYEFGDYVFHTTHIPGSKEKVREANYEFSKLASDGQALMDKLSLAGIVMNGPQRALYKDLTVAWIQDLQRAGELQRTIRHFGWLKDDEGKTGFAVGNFVYWSDGKGDQTMRTDDFVRRWYIPCGEFEPWKAACDFVLKQDRQELAAVIASSFAAPLMKFIGVSGALMSIISRESGTGKTTALQIAQGVWGSPQEGVNALNDTPNSVVYKLGLLKNLPAYWDELRMKSEVVNFVRMVFQLAQGKEKSRLTSSSSMHSMGTWDTLITAASNESVADHVATMVHGSDAGLARVFEFYCNQPVQKGGKEVSDAMKLFGKLKNNYGHAGRIYGKYLAENREEVEKLLERNRDKISELLKVSSSDRFRLAIVVTLITGAQLANKLGITQFNIPALTKFLFLEFKNLRRALREETIGDSALVRLFEFMNVHIEHRVLTKGAQVAVRMPKDISVAEPPKRGPAMFQIHNGSTIIVSSTPFHAWLQKTYNVLPTNIRSELEKLGVEYKQLTLAAGTTLSVGRAWSYQFDTSIPAVAEMMEDYPLDAPALAAFASEAVASVL